MRTAPARAAIGLLRVCGLGLGLGLALGLALAAGGPAAAESWCWRHSDGFEPICAFSDLSRCVDAARIMGGKCQTESFVTRKACAAQRGRAVTSTRPRQPATKACG